MERLRSRSCRLRGKRKSSLAPEAVAVAQEPFAIVNTGDLRLFDELSLLGNERAAAARTECAVGSESEICGTSGRAGI